MNYAQIRQYDIANGEGIRVSLFVSGCHFHCAGCFNKAYQNYDFGNAFVEDTENQVINYLKDAAVAGLSVLGGEPLDQDFTLSDFLCRVKQETGKTIWLWTGYTYETLSQTQKSLVDRYVDVLIDGQFVEELKDLRLKFRGSSNQRILQINTNQNERNILYT